MSKTRELYEKITENINGDTFRQDEFVEDFRELTTLTKDLSGEERNKNVVTVISISRQATVRCRFPFMVFFGQWLEDLNDDPNALTSVQVNALALEMGYPM